MNGALVRICVCAAVFAALLAPALAQEDVFCGGEDLIAKLKARDPAAQTALVENAKAIANGQSVFWKIEGPDGVEPSWLLGTIHFANPRVTEFLPAVQSALDSSASVAIESANGDLGGNVFGAVFKAARFMVLPPGQDLFSLLGEPHAQMLRDLLAKSGMGPSTVVNFQPWVVLVSNFYPACETRMWGVSEIMDQKVANQARATGRTVHYLEDTEVQARMISGIPLKDQLDLLKLALTGARYLEDVSETSIVAWSGPLPAILYSYYDSLIPEQAPERAALVRADKVLLHDRNIIMRDSAMPLIDQGGVFIAVGYFHLIGEDGLVALLKRAGYNVIPVAAP
jgi:uncharacterized protein